MFDAVNLNKQYNFFVAYNGFFSFMQRIPIIGKWFNNSNRWLHKIEGIVVPLSYLFSLIVDVFKKIFYYIFMLFFVTWVLGPFEKEHVLESVDNLVFYFACLTLIGVLRDLTFFYKNDKTTYLFVKTMKMDPRDFYLGAFFSRAINYIISFLIVFYFAFKIAEINRINVPVTFAGFIYFVVFAYSLRYIISYIFLRKNYKKETITRIENTSYVFMGVLTLGSIVLMAIDKAFNLTFLFSPVFLFIGLGIFALTTYLLLNTRNIHELAYNVLTRPKMVDEDLTAQIAGLVNKEGDLKLGEKDFSNYHGIKYINKIFFYRHGKILRKKRRLPTLFLSTIFFVIGTLSIVDSSPMDLTSPENLEFVSDISVFLPYIAFAAAYFIFSGDFFIKYCFYNMDRKLMKHSYFRTSQNILESIKIRAIELLKYHMITFIFWLYALMAFSLTMGEGGIQIAIKTFFAAVLGLLFFSFHYLYIYYILQPFTNDAKVVNPLYGGMTYFIYLAMYLMASSPYAKILLNSVLVFAVIYIILGAFLVSKLAPKRFRLK